MPIKLWWWVEPLFETGMLTVVLFGGLSLALADKMWGSKVLGILAFIGVLPGLICCVSCFVWIVANALFLIWRC